MEGWMRDVGTGIRALVRRPGFSLAVVATLALGIGANTLIFTAVDGTVLRPFPFPEPDRIVGVGTGYPRIGRDLSWFEHASPAEYRDVAGTSRTLQDLVAFDLGNRRIAAGGVPTNTFTAFWWGDALRTLEMPAWLGRGFSDRETADGDAVAVLSHRLWAERFGADSTLVGRTVQVNDEPYTVVGVAPPGVLFYGADLWLPMPIAPDEFPRDRRQFQMVGRIAPGASLEGVNAELAEITRRVAREHAAEFPEYDGWQAVARTWTDINVAGVRTQALILLGAVGFLLLLVCTNVANMLLARARGRRQELAVRTALGAGRVRLFRQLVVESAVLAGVGGAGGLLLAAWGTRGIRSVVAVAGLGLPGEVALDLRVLAFTAAVTGAAALLFGVVPAVHAVNASTAGTLRTEGAGLTPSRSRQRLQRTFVTVEVAVALVLLVGGGLLANTLVRVSRVDPGFDADGLLTMRLTVPPERYPGDAMQLFFQELVDAVEGLPEVASAAATLQYPGVAFARRNFWPEGRVEGDAPVPRTLATLTTRDYLDVVGIPLVQGRGFTVADGPGAAPVAVVNESAARLLFPGEDPVGRRIQLEGPAADAPWFTVVGVAADVRNVGLDTPPAAEVYASHEQAGRGSNQLFLVVRTTVDDPYDALAGIRTVVQGLDPEQPVYSVATVRERLQARNGTQRALALFLGAFAAAALVLASVGIYAVVSHGVGERTREIGLRMALGAGRGSIRGLMVGEALVPVGAGVVAGLVLGVVAARGLEEMLFGITAADPGTLAAVTVLLLAVATTAAWLPARRASRLDPVEALRDG